MLATGAGSAIFNPASYPLLSCSTADHVPDPAVTWTDRSRHRHHWVAVRPASVCRRSLFFGGDSYYVSDRPQPPPILTAVLRFMPAGIPVRSVLLRYGLSICLEPPDTLRVTAGPSSVVFRRIRPATTYTVAAVRDRSGLYVYLNGESGDAPPGRLLYSPPAVLGLSFVGHLHFCHLLAASLPRENLASVL